MTIHSRKSIRFKNYDYSSGGAYFVTICVHDKCDMFGGIKNGEMILSELGIKAKEYWLNIPCHNPGFSLDEFVIMPDHIHGILFSCNDVKELKNEDSFYEKHAGVLSNAPTGISKREYFSKISPGKATLGAVIRSFKSSFTLWCRKNGYKDFKWQRNFFERVIRNERELDNIRQYIYDNPAKWKLEEEIESDNDFFRISS